MITWKTSPHDAELIERIAARALALGIPGKKVDVVMDLTATHANGCALDLDELATADDVNLLHDVGGIRRHLDRSTGQLGGCFQPRFARHQAARS